MTLNQASWLVLALDLAMIVYTLVLLVAGGMGRRTSIIIGSIALAWLIALRAMFSNQQPFPENISGPSFYLVILVGVAVFAGVLFGPRSLRTTLVNMGQPWLLAPQGIRIFFGATFLIWAGEDLLPRTFGIIDGVTHATAGCLGLAAALASARNRDAATLPWIANIFGLGDILIVATSIAFVLLDDIGPHHPMMYAVFAPAPVWLWLHVVSIRHLLVGKRSTMVAVTVSA